MNGILFIEQLYRKTIHGLKIETRRSFSFQKLNHDVAVFNKVENVDGKVGFRFSHYANEKKSEVIIPKFQPDETVYLKEPYILTLTRERKSNDILGVGCEYLYDNAKTWVAFGDIPEHLRHKVHQYKRIGKPVSKLLLPEYLARNFIRIIDVRIERVQDIGPSSCINEGIEVHETDDFDVFFDYHSKKYAFVDPRKSFKSLLETANEGGSTVWSENQFVFVYTYEFISTKKPSLISKLKQQFTI